MPEKEKECIKQCKENLLKCYDVRKVNGYSTPDFDTIDRCNLEADRCMYNCEGLNPCTEVLKNLERYKREYEKGTNPIKSYKGDIEFAKEQMSFHGCDLKQLDKFKIKKKRNR